jgi:RHS repeat-associated protein
MKTITRWLTPALVLGMWLLGSPSGQCFCHPERCGDQVTVGNAAAVNVEGIRTPCPRAKANPLRFAINYHDDESNLLYYGYRYYNASTGRWLSRDPVEEIRFKKTLHRTPLNARKRAEPNYYSAGKNDLIDNHDLLGLYTPTGPVPDGVCCLESSYSKTCDEICRMARFNIEINRTFKYGGGGGVACYHGKACGCLVPDDDSGFYPGDCPAIDAIVQEHEDRHVSNTKCKKCGFYAAGPDDLKPGVNFKDEECEKRKKSLSQMEALRPSLEGKCASVADNLIKLLKISIQGCK